VLERRREIDEVAVELDEHSHRYENTGAALALVVNGHAGGIADPARLGDELVALAEELGARAHSQITHSEPELWEVLAQATASGERVALVGGDGSVHAAANAPLDELPELALLPAGTANNVARALGIATDRRAAVRVAVEALARPLDVLHVRTPETSLYAVEGLSAGFHAAARSRYSAENSSDFRQGLSALAGALREFAPYELRARIGDERVETAGVAQVFLSNLPLFAYGFEVDPGADPADGQLDAVVFRARRRVRLLRLLAAAKRGRHIGRDGVSRTSAAYAELIAPLPLVADAVPLGTTTATVSVVPERLRIAAPREGGLL
jgi:diacylglycerol kinase (ATP)